MSDTINIKDRGDKLRSPSLRQNEQPSKINDYLSFLARVSLSTIFLWSGINKIIDPIATQENMSAHGMPFTSIFLAGAIALEILGGLSVLLGIKPQWGAIMLVVFLVPATLIFHNDLTTEIEQAMFFKNLAMLGGLLMLIQHGGGNLVLWKADRAPSHQAVSDIDIKSD